MKLGRYLRLHFDISSITIILFIIYLIYQPVAAFVKYQALNIPTLKGSQETLSGFIVNILSDLVAAGIIGLSAYLIFKLAYKSSLTGTFTAFDIFPEVKGNDGNKISDERREEWGTVTLTYNLFTNELCGTLISKAGDIEIKLEAKFERGQYLRGHYIEAQTHVRRRAGAFLLMIDGEGKNFEGNYVFVDPHAGNHMPQSGQAIWVRK